MHPTALRARLAATVVVLAVLVAVAGCGGDGGSPSGGPSERPVGHRTITLAPEPAPPLGVHLSFVQQRLDEGTDDADIRVVNGTARGLRVRSVALDWAGYPGGPQPVDYTVPAGSTVDLPYRLPAAACTRTAGDDPPHAVVTAAGDRLRRPVDAEGRRFLHRLRDSECAQRRLDAVVAVGYSDPGRWTARGTGLEATLRAAIVLRRRSGPASVEVDQAQGSVLFEVGLGPVEPLRPRDRNLVVPLRVSPGRCDEHGLSQSQQTFVWRVWLRLDGGEPVAEVVTPDRAQRARLLRFLDDACG